MPPSHLASPPRKFHSASSSTSGVVSEDDGFSHHKHHDLRKKPSDFVRNRKSARLVTMVDELQKSMENVIEERGYYSQRSVNLEKALRDSAPEALSKSITISAIKVADIVMELEDLQEQKKSLEGEIKSMQDTHDGEKKAHVVQLEQLQQMFSTKQDQLKAELKEATGESAALQEKYRTMRRNNQNLTRNIAVMASKIAAVQRENNSLRKENDATHQALIDIEEKSGRSFFGGSGSSRAAIQLRSQLEASRFENEKLIAERTANSSVIQDLRAHIRELQEALAGRAQLHHALVAERLNLSPVSRRLDRLSEPANSDTSDFDTEAGQSTDGWSEIDTLFDTHSSVVETSSSTDSAGTSHSDATPKQANISQELKKPIQSEDGRVADAPEERKARRMPVTVNGNEGSYTGPLDENGLPSGTGTVRFKNGDTYLGDMRAGKLHGKGAMYFSSKRQTTFRGTFQDNMPVL